MNNIDTESNISDNVSKNSIEMRTVDGTAKHSVVYIGESQHCLNRIKIGKTNDNLGKRQSTLNTSYSEYSFKFILVIKILIDSVIDNDLLEYIFHKKFEEYNLKKNGGNAGKEWFDKSYVTIEKIKDLLKNLKINKGLKYDFMSEEEIDNEIKTYKKKCSREDKIKTDSLQKRYLEIFPIIPSTNSIGNGFVFHERFYQEEIIRKSKENLYADGRVLIKSPTGSGKTYSTFRIINELDEIIRNIKSIVKKFVIFTPRKKLNEQNSDTKYLKIMNNTYKVIHKNKFTDKNKFLEEYNSNEFIIVVACYSSACSLMKFMENINIDLVWFDEAHKIESWIGLTKPNHKYWMNNDKIKFRIFSTATPYDSMINNIPLFGKMVEEVKIYELIKEGSLVPLHTVVKTFDNNQNKSYNLATLICTTFDKYNKHKGIIFCNTCDNARALYKLFGDDKYSNIKVFIYIRDNETNYLRHQIDADLHEFEKYKGKAIIISVKMIDMGYDYPPIDLVVFADPKQSQIDIAQAVGRGLRPCNEYENKVLHLLLPIFKKNTKDYDNIIEYIDFVTNECEEPVIRKGDFEFQDGNGNNIIKNYSGDDIPPEIWEKYCTKKFKTFKGIMKLLRKNRIRSENQYNQFRNIKGYGFLPLNMKDKFPNKFCWMELEPERYLYPSTKRECNELIHKLEDGLGEEEYNRYQNEGLTETEQYIELNKINQYEKKIPEMPIDKYYL